MSSGQFDPMTTQGTKEAKVTHMEAHTIITRVSPDWLAHILRVHATLPHTDAETAEECETIAYILTERDMERITVEQSIWQMLYIHHSEWTDDETLSQPNETHVVR